MDLPSKSYATPTQVLEYLNSNHLDISNCREITNYDNILEENYYFLVTSLGRISVILMNKVGEFYCRFDKILEKKPDDPTYLSVEDTFYSAGENMFCKNMICHHLMSKTYQLFHIKAADSVKNAKPIQKNQHTEEVKDGESYAENITCKICLTNKVNIVYIPCGHCFCSDCNHKKSNSICALCRKPINSVQKFFI